MRLISIIIPVYNEADNLRQLHQELSDMAAAADLRCEFIFVDDGSGDNTQSIIGELAKKDPRIILIVLKRNFGQTAAMAAGFDQAAGEVLVTLDGDLQNDPADIPRLIEKLDNGYDLVAGWRKDRQDKFLSRRLPSIIANSIISGSTKVKLHDYGCTLKVFRAEVAKSIRLYGEMHRFIPVLARQMGARICELPVNHRARQHGSSKYTIFRTFRVILDILAVNFFLDFSTRPIHLFGGLGIISGAIGTLVLIYLTLVKFLYQLDIGDRPLLLLGVLLVIVGLQFICFGLLAEVLMRTYHESQGKKIYTIREIIQF